MRIGEVCTLVSSPILMARDWQDLFVTRDGGVAVNEMDDTAVASAVEISVSADKAVKIERVIVAIDCGYIVNPDTVIAQIESCPKRVIR